MSLLTPEQKEIYERYTDGGFSDEQLEEIMKGIEAGYDVSVYARKGIPAEDMAYIRKYLKYKDTVIEVEEPDDDLEKINEDFKEYKEAVRAEIFEKVVVFDITISGLAIITALASILMQMIRLL